MNFDLRRLLDGAIVHLYRPLTFLILPKKIGSWRELIVSLVSAPILVNAFINSNISSAAIEHVGDGAVSHANYFTLSSSQSHDVMHRRHVRHPCPFSRPPHHHSSTGRTQIQKARPSRLTMHSASQVSQASRMNIWWLASFAPQSISTFSDSQCR